MYIGFLHIAKYNICVCICVCIHVRREMRLSEI